MATTITPHLPEVAFARPRHWVVSSGELSDLGLTREAIRHRVRSGRLHRIHRGVYAVGRPHLTREGRWRAATLACGPDAALADLAAAAFWRLLERPDERPHVVVPGRGGRRARTGFTVHRSETLTAADVLVRESIAVTTIPRTLLDLARTQDARTLKAAVRNAERLHRLDLDVLGARAARHPHDVGSARLARLLRPYVSVAATEDEIEAAFVELCAHHGLPVPVPQVRTSGRRLDFLWPEAGLVVEVDGRATHDTAVAFADDRRRDRALQAAGLTVLRFTAAEVLHEPALVAREVRTALARLRRDG